ncbi:MAG: hypothetical protein ABIU05_08830 [Nitrospirales bacterium]
MKKIVLLILLLLISFGCGGERSNVQTPLNLTYGSSTQSNAAMNYQPTVVVGNQPLGRENLVAALNMDMQEQGVHLSVLEAAAKLELTLPEGKVLPDFPPPFNTSTFSAMRVAYPKEFLEMNEATRTRFMTFYHQLDKINSTLGKRSVLIPSALSSAEKFTKLFDQSILQDINEARRAAKY